MLGANGAGKSSLLRIMAGVDQDFQGEAWPHAGTRIGFLSQEPQLDPTKDVRGNVEEAVAATRDLLRRFEELSARFAEPMSDDDMTKLLDEQATVAGAHRCRERLGSRSHDRDRDGCAATAAGRRGCRVAFGG